jgi:hypothetical protein
MAAKPKKSPTSEHSSSAPNDTPPRKPASRELRHHVENGFVCIDGYRLTRAMLESIWQRAQYLLDSPLFKGEISKQMHQEREFRAFPESILDKAIAFRGSVADRKLNALELGIDEAQAMSEEVSRDMWDQRKGFA